MKKSIFIVLFFISFGCSNNSIDPIVTIPIANPIIVYPLVITPSLVAKGSYIGIPTPNGTSSSIPQQNVVISSQTDWSNFLALVNTFAINNDFATTTVDFNNFMIIASIDKVRGTGVETKINSVTENQNNIVVIYQVIYPSALNLTSQTYHVVQVPKSIKPVIFQLN